MLNILAKHLRTFSAFYGPLLDNDFFIKMKCIHRIKNMSFKIVIFSFQTYCSKLAKVANSTA